LLSCIILGKYTLFLIFLLPLALDRILTPLDASPVTLAGYDTLRCSALRLDTQMALLQKSPVDVKLSEEPSTPVDSAQAAPPQIEYERTPIGSPRSLSQMSIFFMGASLFMVSASITRRAIYRRHIREFPRFYVPNTNPHEHFSPFQDAVQALGIATMNVTAVGTMLVGGSLWAFDISNIREMRMILHGRLGYETFDDESKMLLGYVAPDVPTEGSLESKILEKRKQAEGKEDPKSR
jgi:hypothetical protein